MIYDLRFMINFCIINSIELLRIENYSECEIEQRKKRTKFYEWDREVK